MVDPAKQRKTLAMSRENLSLGFMTKSDANQAVQPQKMDRGLKSQI